MAYGINLYNTQNQIMFSSENIAYHFVGKYTAVSQGGTAITTWQLYASFTCSGTPLIFLDSNNGANACSILQLTNTSGNNWTVRVAARNPSVGALSSLDIYVFAFPNNPSSSGWGIWSKNASNITTLNLEQKLLKISGAFVTVGSSSTTSGTPPNATLVFGSVPSNYIICSPILGLQTVPAGPSSLLAALSPRSASSTTMSFLSSYVMATNFAPPNTNSYTLNNAQYIMVADKSLYV